MLTAGDQVLGARLKLVGSCRGPGDEVRIEVLRAEAESLGIADSVDWCAAPAKTHGDAGMSLPLRLVFAPVTTAASVIHTHIPRCANVALSLTPTLTQ